MRSIVLSLIAVGFPAIAASKEEDFTRQVKPILLEHCAGCHGPEKQKGGLRLDHAGYLGKGGNSGQLFQPGNSAKSRMIHALEGANGETRMPPEPKKKLTASQIQIISQWIDAGAKIPEDELVKARPATARNNHWAFQPIQGQLPPKISPNGWAKTPIDHFIQERLDKEGLKPNTEAPPLVLLRRVTLDLTGLAPTSEEVRDFLADREPGAYERVVDRFLASPRFGERWGRLWLDLARYADSDGYEKDTGRPFAWRYRQWVVDALNGNMPLDQFSVEQLAGDLLPNAGSQQKVGTGFHRNTLTNKEGGADQEQFRTEAVVDRVNTTGKVFLGLTLGCAQCHDHKYDPFSQREYFQFFAFFNSDDEVNLAAPELPGEMEARIRLQKVHEASLQPVKKAIEARKGELEKDLEVWEKSLVKDSLDGKVKKVLEIPHGRRNEKQKKVLLDYRWSVDDKGKVLEKQLADLVKNEPKPTMAQTLALGKGRKTHVHIRGDFLRPGVEVLAGTPGVLPALATNHAPNRLDLAQWLTGESNPLTRRVMANWVWHKFFGRGLVSTLEDFGTQGERPSHPQLLDWLAGRLGSDGWNLKEFQRLIVTSAVYRQSSHVDGEGLARDPYNILLSRQSRIRLEAEGVRDVFLQAGGLLDQRIGGPSVRPPQPPGISELTYANAARWNESSGLDRYRRGMYTWFQRTSPYPSLMLFDAPDSNLACVRREKSNTPLQALALLNDVAFYECAKTLGVSTALEKGAVGEKLDQLFVRCTGRYPQKVEKEYLAGMWSGFESHFQKHPELIKQLFGEKREAEPSIAAWVALARVVLNLDEVIVRE